MVGKFPRLAVAGSDETLNSDGDHGLVKAETPEDRIGAIRLMVAMTAAKFAGSLSRVLRRGGGDSLPGMVAERFDPRLAAGLARQLPHGVIIVTGTNGKTTTTKLLTEMLTAAGEKVLSNRTGSNLKQGIVSALIAASSCRGAVRRGYTVGVLEVDEAALKSVSHLIGPKHIVVTNVFRDQLDRYGELDTTASLLGRGIEGTGARIYLNADDPVVASLATYVLRDQVTYFGVDAELPGQTVGPRGTVDSNRCQICDRELEFSRVFYSHIGHYHCPSGHFVRPEPNVAVTAISRTDAEGSEFAVALNSGVVCAQLSLGGLYNLYNAAAALAVADGFGVPASTAVASLAVAEPAFGRVEQVTWRGRELLMILVKNPVGFSMVLDTFLQGQPNAKILIAINDLAADGRDVSWLWDVPFESLAAGNPQVVVSGSRATDMALRLHYAGIRCAVALSASAALDGLHDLLAPGETGYILPTYTAMVALRRELGRPSAVIEPIGCAP